VWGLDLVGPLQKAPGGFSHLLVAIDKFSKWIEVRPLTSIRSEQAVAFFTNIIHRFGVPNSIITDNGTQFTGKKFLDFCEDHHICNAPNFAVEFFLFFTRQNSGVTFSFSFSPR
jgi:transposase InsO family protein